MNSQQSISENSQQKKNVATKWKKTHNNRKSHNKIQQNSQQNKEIISRWKPDKKLRNSYQINISLQHYEKIICAGLHVCALISPDFFVT